MPAPAEASGSGAPGLPPGAEPALGEHLAESSVFAALADRRYEWRTVHGLAAQTGLDAGLVERILEDNGDKVVRSSRCTPDGRAVYATRERFAEFSPIWRKILGALKNRAD